MKKILIVFGLSLSFVIYSPVLADPESNFPSSDINLDNSYVKIRLDTSSVIDPVGYSCSAGAENTDISFRNAGWNETTEEFDNLIDCFHSAGLYTVNIHLEDNASNFNDYTEVFTVKPGDPNASNSSINGSTTGKIADNDAHYNLKLILKDIYSNIITNQIPKIYALSQSFSDDANIKTKFYDGLRIKTSGSWGKIPTSASSLSLKDGEDFYLKALAPSIQKIGNDITELDALDFNGTKDGWLSIVVPRSIIFRFNNLFKVKEDGDIGTTPITNFSISKGISFLNPLFAKPAFSDLTLAEPVDIDVKINKESSNPSFTSMNLTETSVKGDFCDTNSTTGELENCGIIDESSNINIFSLPTNAPKITKTINEPGGSTIGPEDVALVTIESYTLDGKNISYPAGGVGGIFDSLSNKTIGLNGGTDVKFIGANIEGFVGGDENKIFLGESGTQILNIGVNSKQADIYEKIVKNGWELARNSANTKTNNNGGNNLTTLFNGNNVVVVNLSSASAGSNSSFEISGQLPSGKNTLILIDGNLKITGNLYYNTTKNEDSFGVIVLRSEAGEYPERGNIFVAPTVQRIAGSYFADGGFMTNNTDDVTKGNTSGTANLTSQLLLEGSLLSRNTLGGSLRGTGNGGNDDFSPWEDDASQEVAERYDLHYVRRYYPGAGTAISGETNDAAFIIRLDNKAYIMPPPGFSVR